MTLHFILNGEDVEISSGPNQRLICILREKFSLFSSKSGCLCGNCGACSVIFNGAVSPACLIPAFRLENSEIITLEGFYQQDEYKDISIGFSLAGVESCGYCDAGRILNTELLLGQSLKPSREAFSAAFRGIRCRCIEEESLYQGIVAAGLARQKRLYGR